MDWEICAKMKLKIILALFYVFVTVQGAPEIHELHYIYTALSKPISQPGVYQFAAMGILDDRPIDIYNSEDKVKRPLQEWMKEQNEKDYWEKGTQSRRSKEQWFDVNVKILMERMHQNKSDPDVHILQWMHGCQVEKTPDGKLKFRNGFDQYGYDGEDFLAFDSENMAWVAPVPAAESTKTKWDNVPILSQYTKGYLQTDCVHWLEKFLMYQELDFQTSSPPEVYIFSKKSTSPDYRTLVCLATRFYPKDVSVNILKDGVLLTEFDGVISSGVRTNGERKETFQLRKWLEIKASDTSKYSCRIHHPTLLSPIEKSWGNLGLSMSIIPFLQAASCDRYQCTFFIDHYDFKTEWIHVPVFQLKSKTNWQGSQPKPFTFVSVFAQYQPMECIHTHEKCLKM